MGNRGRPKKKLPADAPKIFLQPQIKTENITTPDVCISQTITPIQSILKNMDVIIAELISETKSDIKNRARFNVVCGLIRRAKNKMPDDQN